MLSLKDCDHINAKPYLLKLAIILEDPGLHEEFQSNNGVLMLKDLLTRSLVLSDEEPCISAMSSIFKSLLQVAESDRIGCIRMANDSELLMGLLR